MNQVFRRNALYGYRRGVLYAVALTAAWSVSVGGTAAAAPITDPQSRQWYLEAMTAEKIWKTSTGEGIKVAVIDSGVNPSTPSLKGQVLKGVDFSGAAGEASDDFDGHGTSMAELIAGTGKGGGLKGLAPGAKIIPYRVSDTELQNQEKVNAFDMEQAIRAAVDSEAHIINVSMGSEYYNTAIRDGVKYAQRKGKLLFASSGNEATKGNKKAYPAAYPEAIAVAASGPDGNVGDYSVHGAFVDIAAPGSEIPTYCDKALTRYCLSQGTSIATAIASASAALIWSKHPDWNGNQVLRVMFESAARDWKPGTISTYLGHGIVRPGAHINRGLGKPGDPNITPLTNERVGGTASASPKPSAPASTKPQEGKPGSEVTAAGASKDAAQETDGDSKSGLVIGGVALVVALAGAAYAIARRRRSA
ncbi:S8 family serine peptidase [Streptomyces gobitricini]|uniref:Type VII secretion-associated serine protease mycosin n=1 Tax=Streptomyces gobitricini TaxID=68211 RepID=A0ABN3N9G8_9ACTN